MYPHSRICKVEKYIWNYIDCRSCIVYHCTFPKSLHGAAVKFVFEIHLIVTVNSIVCNRKHIMIKQTNFDKTRE